jgi:hypothetical protein
VLALRAYPRKTKAEPPVTLGLAAFVELSLID